MSIHTLRFYCALQGQEFEPIPWLNLFLGYQGQCNWWFDAEILKLIGELNLDLTLSCSEVEDSVDPT